MIEARGRVLADMVFPESATGRPAVSSWRSVTRIGLLEGARPSKSGASPSGRRAGHDVMWFAAGAEPSPFGDRLPEAGVPENSAPDANLPVFPICDPSTSAWSYVELLLIEFRAERALPTERTCCRMPELSRARRADAEHAAEIV